MKVEFGYNRKQVLQALRYHFISRKEIRLMIILVNVFAIFALALYLAGKIAPMAFILNSSLWIVLMISFWYVLPGMVYRRNETFKHRFIMYFNENDFVLEHEKGKRSWPYSVLHSFKETPNFFHLYFNPRSFFLVPKDGFQKTEDIVMLRSLLKGRLD